MAKLDSQQVELVGMAALEAELIKQGFEVAHPNRDQGIDLIVYTDEPSRPFRAVPIQVKASSKTGFGAYRNMKNLTEWFLLTCGMRPPRPVFLFCPIMMHAP